MTREEIKKAIDNGDEIWLAVCTDWEPISVKADEQHCDVDDEFFHCPFITLPIGWVHKTKAEAEHYLHHANVTRTETLPFLTWEEFLEKKAIHFIDNKGIDFVLCITDNKIKLMVFFMVSKTWDLTEANFYKAYDECVRLFRGE